MIRNFVRIFSENARSKRGKIFYHALNPQAHDKILDLGGGSGAHIAGIIPYRENVFLADINARLLALGERQFGFKTKLLDETGRLPFADASFDIVFCSSVIEHVTVSKKSIKEIRTNREFFDAAYKRQRQFAGEIRRVGKCYFVQTPYKYFPIESHTWLPVFIVLLPRTWQIAVIDFLNKWWPKTTSPDWNLLTKEQMQELFPDAKIVSEKVLGFTKSIMAIKR